MAKSFDSGCEDRDNGEAHDKGNENVDGGDGERIVDCGDDVDGESGNKNNGDCVDDGDININDGDDAD